jgi:tetratricopeptide (TPR) repeat protein
MKIPVLYLVLGILVIAVLTGLKMEMKTIGLKADEETRIQAAKDLREYSNRVRNIKSAEFAMKRGMAFFKTKDFERAEMLFSQAAEIDKNYHDAQFYKGYSKLKLIEKHKSDLSAEKQQEKLEEARNVLLAAQKLNPLSPLDNKILAMVYEQQGNDKEAQLWYARFKEVGGK